jgi:asparagine synthase (glutamine-hydrolysing)
MALSGRYNSAPRRILWEYALKPLAPGRVRHAWQTIRGRAETAWTFNTAINPAFARRVGLAARVEALQRDRAGAPRTAREGHWRALTAALIPYTLEIADKAAAAFGIESRYPFFDWRLAQFCLALPPEQKLSNGWTRAVMRRAMADVLPDAVRWRAGKGNLSPNFRRGLFESDRGLLEGVMTAPQIIEEYVDVPALREAYDRCVSRGASDDDALTVYGAVTLALWLRQTGLTS